MKNRETNSAIRLCLIAALVFSFILTGCPGMDDLADLVRIPERFRVAGVQLEFKVGDPFTTNGIVVIVTYNDSTTETYNEAQLEAKGISVDHSLYSSIGVNAEPIPIYVKYKGEICETYYVNVINTAVTTAMPTANPSYAVVKIGDSVTVELECSTDGAEIWFTINGLEPAQGYPGIPYTSGESITFDLFNTTTLKAKAFSDKEPSATMKAVYYLADDL